MSTTHSARRGFLWILAYLFIVTAPLTVLTIGSDSEGKEFRRELSIAFAFTGLAMLSLQFLITARFRAVSAPYGVDILLQFHRLISVVAFGLVLFHPILLFTDASTRERMINPITAPWVARIGWLGLFCFFLIFVTSFFRRLFPLSYEGWRTLHGGLASAGLILGLVHALMIGNYLSTPINQAVWVTVSIGIVLTLFWVRVVKPFLVRKRPYRVTAVQRETPTAWSLVLEPVGHAGLSFSPGQFAWLTLGESPFGMHEHPFSMSSSSEKKDSVAFTIKESGDFTGRIGDVKPGTTAYVDGPAGAFSIDRYPAEGYVFIAGGVGIAPIMSFLRTLRDRSFKGDVLLIYANRNEDEIIFREDLKQLQQDLELEIAYVLDEAPEGWTGETRLSHRRVGGQVCRR